MSIGAGGTSCCSTEPLKPGALTRHTSLEHSIIKSHHPSDVDPRDVLLWSGKLPACYKLSSGRETGMHPDNSLGEVGPVETRGGPGLGAISALTGWMVLGKSLVYSGPQFPLLQNQGVFRSMIHRLQTMNGTSFFLCRISGRSQRYRQEGAEPGPPTSLAPASACLSHGTSPTALRGLHLKLVGSSP